GRYRVRLVDGTTVAAVPVLRKLRERLEAYPLERVAAITGAPAGQIERIATEAARQGPLHVVYGASDYQWYHGD
ncbi:MAG: hypothetical protein GWM90_21480, partial [Gemmatimonadetes bacterium]|nr:hypothetical protein [Gemmatimonadota bacterium]NIQ57118.1 hypothetical protein [Gemmatimonadota bacterium]NIU77285.1 hypothetical protein [Gammaproteobacteria bacterium]NIX46559.1 hypothetical protein [Gemmatimonadota bacterium]NIY10877.1 hypothetical protein [Gemmatimonadota bacterium]